MSGVSAMHLTKTVMKLEKPRPLKVPTSENRHTTVDSILSSIEDVMALVDAVSMRLQNEQFDKILQTNVTILSSNLKIYGSQLEAHYKDQLDRAYVVFRESCRNDGLYLITRLQLLELVELRATNWMPCDNMNSYYKPKLSIFENEMFTTPETRTYSGMSLPLLGPTSSSTIVQPPLLPPGEVINTSGKFAKPTKIPGKNYCKDEVVIRNSDSGKVSSGTKERLVQTTGPAEGTINYAKQRMEYTNQRNASQLLLEQPEKERIGGSSSNLNSSAFGVRNRLVKRKKRTKLLHSLSGDDESLGEYVYTVTVGNHTLKITGSNFHLAMTAKLRLDEYFTGIPNKYIGSGDFITSYEDPAVPDVDAATNVGNRPNRVGSMDSAATSESDETYKETEISTSENECDDSIDTVPWQPLFPDASREACEQEESTERSTDVNARNRRALSAITNQQQSNLETQLKSDADISNAAAPRNVKYSREFLLLMALSIASCEPPAEWEQIGSKYPEIIKPNYLKL